MNSKTLYGLIFVPIILLPAYFLYNSTENKEIKNNTTNTNFMENYFEQIGLEEFKKELENPETILIDVRTPEELIKFGKIRDNQKLIVFGSDNFAEEILKLDKTKKYLLYCWHGNRSATTREFMKENGFIWVKDLKGGIEEWNKG